MPGPSLCRRIFPCIAILVAIAVVAATPASGQVATGKDAPAKVAIGGNSNGDDAQSPTIKQLRKRIANLDKKIAELKAQRDKDQKVPPILPLLESMYYGPRYYSSSGPRYFVGKLVVVNLSGKPLTLKREDITLRAKSKTFRIPSATSLNQTFYFYIGTERHTLGSLKPAQDLSIKPGAAGVTWVVYQNVGTENDIPPMSLRMNFNQQPVSLDVNQAAREQLKLTVERIGPRKGLGLLTIAGPLNTVNIGGLVSEIDKLTKSKPPVQRFVIHWTKGAPQINSRMLSWLRNEARYAGQKNRNSYSRYPFPDLPGTIRELHLARLPGVSTDSSYYRDPSSRPDRIHKSAVVAVSAALASAYEVLPRKEIIEEIESGHPLTRAAALASGGGRLGADKLPMILEFAQGKDEQLARAALRALRHFGEKPAIETLVKFAKDKSSKRNQPAVVSLSASRFPVAHRALLKILKDAPLESKKAIVKVLATHPRPIWSEPIYEFAKDPNSGVGAEAVKALGAIGHPKLFEVLKDSLTSKDNAVRVEALRQLVGRADAKSDAIALEYTLEQLKKSPPDSWMKRVLIRTKDQRAIPLLLAQLDKEGGSKSTLIETLSSIGDQTVGKELAKRYDTIKSTYDKSRIMKAMVKLKTPGIRKLAGEALMTKNSSLINAACDALRRDAGPEAVKLLIHALEKSTYSSAWSYTSSSLAQIGTKKAKLALVRIRTDLKGASSNDEKQKLRYVVNAIRSMMQRSPAYSYVYQAWRYTRQKKYKEALNYCNIARKLDPDHPWPFSARGHVYLLQKKLKEARKDFEAAYKLDPHDPHAITGVALLKSRDGKTEEAVKLVAKHANEFSSDRFYPYQAARVYARAITKLKKSKPSKQRDKKIAEYGKEAMKQLKIAITRGRHYSDGFKPNHATKEADFEPLRELKEYKTLIGGASKKKGNKAGGAEKLIRKE